MRISVLPLVAIALICEIAFMVPVVFAATEVDQKFEPPVLLDAPDPLFPKRESGKRISGAADIIFMVDRSGKVFEPAIIHSTKSAFEKPSISAVMKYKFSPANINGQPIDSLYRIKIPFIRKLDNIKFHDGQPLGTIMELQRQIDLNPRNTKKINKLVAIIERARRLTPELYIRFNSAIERLSFEINDQKGQIRAIENILLFENSVLEGESEILSRLHRVLFGLYVDSKQYGKALSEYEAMIAAGTKLNSENKHLFSRLQETQSNDLAVFSSIEIAPRRYTSRPLFKNTFSFQDIKGKIESLKLRCQRKFQTLDFNPDNEYQIPKSWGQCHLQIIGEPGTTAQLIEY